MKKSLVLGVIIMLIIGSCAQEEKPPVTVEKSPLEGAWKLVYGYARSYDLSFPDQVEGGQIKFWSKDHFAFAGLYDLDTLVMNSLGGGTYTLDGDRCEEHIKYHCSEASIGRTYRILIEIRNDTLIQKWPADENWMLPEQYSIEKYIRLD